MSSLFNYKFNFVDQLSAITQSQAPRSLTNPKSSLNQSGRWNDLPMLATIVPCCRRIQMMLSEMYLTMASQLHHP